MDDKVLLPDGVHPEHYDIHIKTNTDRPNAKGELEFEGKLEIDLDVMKDLVDTIVLHSKELVLEEPCVFSTPEVTELFSTSVEYDEELETVSISFPDVLPKGKAFLTIKYTGIHNNQMAGFYKSSYTNIHGETKTMVSTQFEALDARRCFPCVDEPAIKATFSCTLDMDEHLSALSNMPERSTELLGNGVKSVRFETTPMMSTYLLAFCVGEFDWVGAKTKNGVMLKVYTPPGKRVLGNFALDIGVRALDLYDDTFGEKFPLPKMDMVAIPEFAAGAMENWGLVTYREVDLLIDPVTASAEQKQRVCAVVVHELAHQWFGNLVTMEWWNDLWLNEGFASYMESYIINQLEPSWLIRQQFVNGPQTSALSLDALLSSHPIQVPIKHAKEVDEVFDMISYAKGSCIVRFLHAVLGEEDFLGGLRKYMTKHKYENTVTHDLWAAWEDVSGKDITGMMSSWTEQMGFPLVTVTSSEWSENECKLTLQQEWFLADGSKPEGSAEKLWNIPLFVSTDSGTVMLEEPFTKRTQEFVVPLSGSSWLKLNGGQHIPLRVNYTEDLWSRLLQAFKANKVKDVCDKIGVVKDALALVKAQHIDPVVLLEFLSTFKSGATYPEWCAVADSLNTLGGVLKEDQELQKQLGVFAGSIVHDPAEKIGWENKESDSHLDLRLRGLLIQQQCKVEFSEASTVEKAKARFNQYIADPLNPTMGQVLPADYRVAAFNVVLKSDMAKDAYKSLRNALDQIETSIEKKQIYSALGHVEDMELKREILDWTTSGEVKLQDFFYPVVSVSSSGLEGLVLTWDYLKEHFDRVYDMVKTANPSILNAYVSYSCGGFTSATRADEIEAFFKEKNVTTIQRSVKQLVERIRGNAKFADYLRSSEKFTTFLKNCTNSSQEKKGGTRIVSPPKMKRSTRAKSIQKIKRTGSGKSAHSVVSAIVTPKKKMSRKSSTKWVYVRPGVYEQVKLDDV